ncbi:MAG: hypothetical protein H7Z75_15980 [Ferruginibacter sp.]|nr:hypothetical protein [Cytophagales bacterium]
MPTPDLLNPLFRLGASPPGGETTSPGGFNRTLIPFESVPGFRHYASDLVDRLGYTSFEEILEPLDRARRACRTMGIPDDQHFKPVYRFNSLGMNLRRDYRLTPLASYLVTVNADPANVNVARAQVYFFLHYSR